MANKGNLNQQQSSRGGQSSVGMTTDKFGNQVSIAYAGKDSFIPPSNFVLGEGLNLDNGVYYIDQYDDNIIEHRVKNKIYDYEDIKELQDNTIFELLPKPVELPINPPVSGKLYVANWSRVLDFGGVTDSNKNPDINSITDWSTGQWQNRHKWPRDYTLDPVYLFFTGDPPIFYSVNTISHYEGTNAIPIAAQDIVWKLDGKEVHKGWYLELGDLTETVQQIGGQTVMVPRTIRCEINNKAGMISEEIKYACVDSDNAESLAGVDEVDNFTSTLEGRFVIDTTNRGVTFEADPRYGPREMFMRFKWKNFGKGESPVRKFKGKCKVKIDGVTVYNDLAVKLDGGRSAFGEFLNDFFAPIATISATLFTAALGPIGWALVAGVGLAAGGKLKEIFDDSGSILDDDRPLGERGVTDWTDGKPSALLYTTKDDDEWNQMVMTTKKPGPFKIEVSYSFKYRTGFFNLGKKWRRTYKLSKTYDSTRFNLDVPLQEIDLGVHTVSYTDKKL